MFRFAGMKTWIEDEQIVNRYRRFLPGRGTSGKGLVQFWSRDGGLRTVDVGTIIHIS